jgi:hypothetical protein
MGKRFTFQNFIKGPVTTILGLAIAGTSAYSASFGYIPWVWEGLAGAGVGLVFMFTPDSIKEILSAIIKKRTE